MVVPPKQIDLTKLTSKELKSYLANNQKAAQTEAVLAALHEMERRGIATRTDFQALHWNQDSISQVMQPFKEVASAVPDNQRTAYTEAGGLRIGRSKNDPEWFWIDTYSAIKTPAINAILVCYVKRPGEEPEFKLQINGEFVHSYNADHLTDALVEWKKVAAKAIS